MQNLFATKSLNHTHSFDNFAKTRRLVNFQPIKALVDHTVRPTGEFLANALKTPVKATLSAGAEIGLGVISTGRSAVRRHVWNALKNPLEIVTIFPGVMRQADALVKTVGNLVSPTASPLAGVVKRSFGGAAKDAVQTMRGLVHGVRHGEASEKIEISDAWKDPQQAMNDNIEEAKQDQERDFFHLSSLPIFGTLSALIASAKELIVDLPTDAIVGSVTGVVSKGGVQMVTISKEALGNWKLHDLLVVPRLLTMSKALLTGLKMSIDPDESPFLHIPMQAFPHTIQNLIGVGGRVMAAPLGDIGSQIDTSALSKKAANQAGNAYRKAKSKAKALKRDWSSPVAGNDNTAAAAAPAAAAAAPTAAAGPTAAAA